MSNPMFAYNPVYALAFAAPVYDIDMDQYIPTSETHAVTYGVFVYNSFTGAFELTGGYFESLESAMDAAIKCHEEVKIELEITED